jgi:tetratricopeptide (TPR) repeat protein
MPYVRTSLRETIAPETLSSQAAVELGVMMLHAIVSCRKSWKDFTHGDIKPENILVHDDGTPMLSDFGLSSALTRYGDRTLPIRAGTRAYMSPQVLEGAEATPSDDIYSLGLTLVEAATGHLPRRVATSTRARLATSLAYRNAHWFDLPASVRKTLSAMIGGNRKSRPSATECLDVFSRHSSHSCSTHFKFFDRDARDVIDLMSAATSLADMGAFDDARILLDQAESAGDLEDRYRFTITIQRASIAYVQGDIQAAIGLLARVKGIVDLQAQGLRQEFFALEARLKRASGDLNGAIDSIRLAIESMPLARASDYQFLGHCLGDQGIWVESIRALERAAELSYDVVTHHYLILASMESETRDHTVARAEHCVALNPTSGYARAIRLRALGHRGVQVIDAQQFESDIRMALGDPQTPAHLRDYVAKIIVRDGKFRDA